MHSSLTARETSGCCLGCPRHLRPRWASGSRLLSLLSRLRPCSMRSPVCEEARTPLRSSVRTRREPEAGCLGHRVREGAALRLCLVVQHVRVRRLVAMSLAGIPVVVEFGAGARVERSVRPKPTMPSDHPGRHDLHDGQPLGDQYRVTRHWRNERREVCLAE